MDRKRWVISWAALLCAAGCAWGQVTVRKSGGDKVSLGTGGLSAEASQPARTWVSTLRADLSMCGWFLPTTSAQAPLQLQGRASQSGGSLSAEVRLSAGGDVLLAKTYQAPAGDARRLAHRVADDVIRAATGQKGFLSARLALIGNRTGAKEVYLCDADGQGVRQLTEDRSVSLAPRWSPDGNALLYTTFVRRFPDVYRIDLRTGTRSPVAAYPGLNTSAAYSPDGRYVALILSRDGNPELYIKHLADGRLTRLTTTRQAAEASPCWSPDGSQIVYVSDISGRPQLYTIDRNGGAPRRLTGRGSQNVDPDWGPNGWIAYAGLMGGRFHIYIINPLTGEMRQVSPGDADYEDPSWAPDGRHLAAVRTQGYASRVYLLDTGGDSPLALTTLSGDWTAPAWSPE